MKIFNLGFPKTGTTSLIRAMEILGYKNTMFPDKIKEYNCLIGDPCIFADYKALNEKYNIKFLMTIRKDPEIWFNSVLRWSQRPENQYELIKSQRKKMYGYRMPKGHKDEFIEVYNNRLKDVKGYFKDKDNLLILNFENGDGWFEICEYLGRKIPNVPFPHLNKQK